MSNNVFVTCILITYNQADYIKYAIDSLLSQDYSNLEIIISDDASTDGTQEIIIERLKLYSGPHTTRLNFNKINMGISMHVRHVHNMAKGEIIVHSAGDDISEPHRVSRIVSAYVSNNRPSMVISNAIIINETGNIIGTLVKDSFTGGFGKARNILKPTLPYNGCTVAISRELVNSFDDPLEGLYAEDVVLSRRAHLKNGVYYIPQCLVRYRQHASNISSFNKNSHAEKLKYYQKAARELLLGLQQLIKDSKHTCYQLTNRDVKEIDRQQKLNLLLLDLINAPILLSAPLVLKAILSPASNIAYKRKILSVLIAKIMLNRTDKATNHNYK